MTPARKSTRRIAAVHDLSGVGRVSLMVVIPILSTMGFDVCPLPTAILSNHTQYPEYSFLDLTDEMPKMIAGWKKLEIEFDAIYTGYLGSPRQIQIVSGFIDDFRREDTLIVVDPVLGDNGRLYAGMTKEMVIEMRVLARRADVLTPNLTELFALLDRPYQHECSDELLKEALKALSAQGPDTVIITGVPVVGRPYLTSVAAPPAGPGRSRALTFRPIIRGRAMPLRASSPGRFCRVTAFRLRLTERPSSFCRAFARLSAIRATIAKAFCSNGYCPISICRFSRRPTSSFDWGLGSGYAKRPPVRRASAAVKVL